MQAARGAPLTPGQAAPAGNEPAGPAGRSRASAGSAPGSGVGPPPRRRVGVLVSAALIVLTLDIVSKAIVVTQLSGRSVRLLGGFLTLLVSRNPGAAFSIGTSMTVVFSVIAVSVIVVILRTSRRIRSIPWALTLGLLLGGAMGNLTDRIFRYPGLFRGYVVDWIEWPHWPVFNLADSAIVCGGILAVLLSMRGSRLDGSRAAATAAGAAAIGQNEPPSAGPVASRADPSARDLSAPTGPAAGTGSSPAAEAGPAGPAAEAAEPAGRPPGDPAGGGR